MKKYLLLRYKYIQQYMDHPVLAQELWLNKILSKGVNTSYGHRYDLSKVKNVQDFQKAIPLNTYNDLQPLIQKMMLGEKDVLWPGRIKWFSKSSGTSGNQSKFIPVSPENIRCNHIRGTWDTMSMIYKQRPNSLHFQHKTLLMGGTIDVFEQYNKTYIGDISAIMIKHMPVIGRPFFTPNFELALEKNLEFKIEEMAKVLSKEKDLVMIGGVPTWTMLLLKRILEITGAEKIIDVWPKLLTYSHGGVSFLPYEEQFKKIIGSSQVDFFEIYNASEGYMGIQSDYADKSMLLLLNNGIFYEFIPLDTFTSNNPIYLTIKDVEIGIDYAIVITNNSGLWRYVVGDTVTFTNLKPHKIKITGRTEQFINTFGEEVMVANTDKAIQLACKLHNCEVIEYTVAPIWLTSSNKGGHEWIIEFKNEPLNLAMFEKSLDESLQAVNSDYQAKRTGDMAMKRLKINVVHPQTFHNWMKSKGKYGGQHKVKRLSSERKVLESILNFDKLTKENSSFDKFNL